MRFTGSWLVLSLLVSSACDSPTPTLPPVAPSVAAAPPQDTPPPPPTPRTFATPPPATTGSGGGSGSATPAVAPRFVATLSSASIGQDCPAPAAASTAPSSSASTRKPITAGKRAPGGGASASQADALRGRSSTPSRRPRCKGSEMVLQLDLTGAPGATVRIASATVSTGGTRIGDVTPSDPTRWDTAGSRYVPWDGTLASAGPAGVRYALSPLPAASAGARSYELAVAVEAVLADGTVLRSETTYLTSIAVEPHMVT